MDKSFRYSFLFTLLILFFLGCSDKKEQPSTKIVNVESVPDSLNFSSFYRKYVDAIGIPVVSSNNVSDSALLRAREVVTQILSKREDVKKAMIANRCKVMIIGEKENVCDLPEYAKLCDTPQNIAYWNQRSRGFGGSPEEDASASCGEENVLGLASDRYKGESILVHEFAHLIHLAGIAYVNPSFNDELEALLSKAIKNGLWKDTYAISDKEEYFAECVQSFFNCNRYSEKADGVHNSINTRQKLKEYDANMYNLLLQYFPEIDLSLSAENKTNI